MGDLTLVAEAIAKPGFTFTYRGANQGPECEGCPVKALCFRLRPGHRYRVQEVREVTHPCNLHDGDRVAVCVVEEVPVATSAQTKNLRGTALRWEPVPCGYPECERYAFCHPVGVPAGRYEVVRTGKAMDCPMRYALQEVTLRLLE